jgi:hypothetical protein
MRQKAWRRPTIPAPQIHENKREKAEMLRLRGEINVTRCAKAEECFACTDGEMPCPTRGACALYDEL